MSIQSNVVFNRIVAFLAGGLLIFAIMNFTVVKNIKTQNTELLETLDTSRYEASRLLADAKAQYTAGNFEEAKVSLTTLFDNQPGSIEAKEGKTLFSEIEKDEEAINSKWENALATIQPEWEKKKALELRTKWDADRAKLENDMENLIAQAWVKEEKGIRAEWLANN